MNLIAVRDNDPRSPYTPASSYIFHSQGKYPNLIFKVGNKLMLDLDEWQKMAEKAKTENIKKAAKLRNTRG